MNNNRFLEELKQDQKSFKNVFDVVDSDEDSEQIGKQHTSAIQKDKYDLYPTVKVNPQKKIVYRTPIILNVKVYEEGDDILDNLAKKIFDEINMDGIVWIADYKKIPVAFGLKKLQIMCYIEDEKINSNDIIDRIQEYEDIVQSVDTSCIHFI